MGSDLHGDFINNCSTTGLKTPIKTEWGMNRDYTLFAILAGVRNGYGFAGCYTHEPLVPIVEDRGLPEWLDTSVDEDGCEDYSLELYNKWYGSKWASPDEKEFGEWMGDHSHTYMNLREIILWEGWNKHLQRGGVLSKDHYLETIAVGKEPECWCGGVGGGNTNVVEEEIFKALIDIGGTGDKITHVKCNWKESETLRENYKWFLDEINRIGEDYGYEDTYLVVGFDS